MIRKLICVECPLGCSLEVDVENGIVPRVSGNKCPKGQTYGRAEVENPARVLTSSVVARGLAVKMVPVRTDAPIPKARLMEAMAQVRKVRLDHPVKAGEVIIPNLLGLGVNLIATRSTGDAPKGATLATRNTK